MKELAENLVAIGLVLAFLCVPFVIGLLFLPIAVLGTVLFIPLLFIRGKRK